MNMNMNMNMNHMMPMNPPPQFPPPRPVQQRSLSGYNIFVRAKSLKLKQQNPMLPQGDLMKKVGQMWRELLPEQRAQWRPDGEEGSRVPGSQTYLSQRALPRPSNYQMFVKHMTTQLHQQHPGSKQADNMRKIGEMWRNLAPEEKDRYTQEAMAAHELQQQQQVAAQAAHFQAQAQWNNGMPMKGKGKKGGGQRTLSAYNIFVRAKLLELKAEHPHLEQADYLKTVGHIWANMSADEKAQWRTDGEKGSKVPGSTTWTTKRGVVKPSAYQMFVKAKTAELHGINPSSKQADNMRVIGQAWREMGPDDRQRYVQEAQTAYEQLQQQAQQNQNFGMYNQQQWANQYNQAPPPQGQTTVRTLSAYNLFVRQMLHQLKQNQPDLEQGDCMRKVGAYWRSMSTEERNKWRHDGEHGSQVHGATTFVMERKVAKPSSYQMFVKRMTAEMQRVYPNSKQSENMRKIGEMWRGMSAEDRQRYAEQAEQAHQAQLAAAAQQQQQQQMQMQYGQNWQMGMPGGKKGKRKRGQEMQGMFMQQPPPGPPAPATRVLSAYNLFVRYMLQQLKQQNPRAEQGECMKKVGEIWQAMASEEKQKWRADGEHGSKVPGSSTYVTNKPPTKPSSYQMFVKHMSAELNRNYPHNKQADNMRKIGEIWRTLSAAEKSRYQQEAEQQHEANQASHQSAHHYGPGGNWNGGYGGQNYGVQGQRTLSAYNLFVRSMLQELKAANPDLEQGDLMKKVGEMWRGLSVDEKSKWRFDGEKGRLVPGNVTYTTNRPPVKPSSYQNFVKHMSAELHHRYPGNKQAENMRKIGEMWRAMNEEDKAKWRTDDLNSGPPVQVIPPTAEPRPRKKPKKSAPKQQNTQQMNSMPFGKLPQFC